MTRREFPSPSISFIILAVSLVLSGCLNLAADVTPPPGIPQSSPVVITPVPTKEPTQEQPQSSDNELDDPTVGVITVEVLDQTGGFLLDQNLDVHLEGFDHFEPVYQETLPLPSSGTVNFGDVPFLEGRVFFASVPYGGAIYRSEITEFGPGASSLSLSVQIFDTTTDDAGLIIDRLHIFIDFPQPDLAQIAEIYIFSNLGNSTLVAEAPDQATVLFPLPSEASGIDFEDGVLGQRYLKTQDGFGDTVSIPPGMGVYQVVVYYTLPYQRNKLDFIQTTNYPVGAVVVMTPDSQVKVKGSYLEDLGVQAMPDGNVQVYSGDVLGRGEELQFQLSGKPEIALNQADPSGRPFQGYVIAFGVLGAVILLTGIYLFLRNRKTEVLEDERVDGGEDRDQILDSIIALEDLFNTGEIPEKTFLEKRDQLKKKFTDLKQ